MGTRSVAREFRDGLLRARVVDDLLAVRGGRDERRGRTVGYEQLLEVERAWRDMKTTLELRPVFHRKEERIRAHVLLCWLSLLLIRVAETGAHDTWRNVRREMDKLHLGRFSGTTGEVLQRTEVTPRQASILKALSLLEPPRILGLTPSLAAATA